MITSTFAKVNLTLEVLGKRPDNYHELRMIMQSVSISDQLKFTLNQSSPNISITSSNSELPLNEDNIIAKIFNFLQKKLELKTGLNVEITKNIPIAAGLAGGSSNAAATILAINKLYNLNLTEKDFFDICTKFGSDIYFSFIGGSKLATGRGEILKNINIPKLHFVLINPNFPVSTADVFRNLKIQNLPKINQAFLQKLEVNQPISYQEICQNMLNNLETVTTKMHSEINEIKELLLDNGASASMMSGSGPTCFGIFESPYAAQKAAENIQSNKKNYWVHTAHSVPQGIEIN